MLRGTTPPIRQGSLHLVACAAHGPICPTLTKTMVNHGTNFSKQKKTKMNPQTTPQYSSKYTLGDTWGFILILHDLHRNVNCLIAKMTHFWLSEIKNCHPSHTFGFLDSKIATPLKLLALWTQKLPPLSQIWLFGL